MFRKQIGILLNQNPTKGYEICAKMSHNDVFRVVKVYPIVPNTLPPLNELLNRSMCPQHDAIRFNLLKWIINEEKLKNFNIEAVPRIFLFDILTLNFMVYEKFIEPFEADIILLSFKHVVTETVPENMLVPPTVNSRAFMIPFLLKKIHVSIGRCLEVTGLKEFNVKFYLIFNIAFSLKSFIAFQKVPNFDGVLFHNLYKKFVSEPFNIKVLLGDLANYRHYA